LESTYLVLVALVLGWKHPATGDNQHLALVVVITGTTNLQVPLSLVAFLSKLVAFLSVQPRTQKIQLPSS